MIWKLTAAKARILETVCTRVLKMKGGPGIRVVNSPDGITVSLEDRAKQVQQQSMGRSILIPVTLSDDGGADGTSSAAPTYTYKWPTHLVTAVELTNADGSRATGLSPAFARPVGSFNRATKGIAYFDSEGLVKLLSVDETEVACTEDGATGTYSSVTVANGIVTSGT